MEHENNGAAKVNPALEPFAVLVGEWETVGTHPQLPGVSLHGHTSFSWMEGGAFLMMRSNTEGGQIPSAIAIIGSDNTKGEFFMLYFDERPVSRKCDVTIDRNVWRWSRDAPEFSQRFSFVITESGNIITGSGEMAKTPGHWEPDLAVTYTRVEKQG